MHRFLSEAICSTDTRSRWLLHLLRTSETCCQQSAVVQWIAGNIWYIIERILINTVLTIFYSIQLFFITSCQKPGLQLLVCRCCFAYWHSISSKKINKNAHFGLISGMTWQIFWFMDTICVLFLQKKKKDPKLCRDGNCYTLKLVAARVRSPTAHSAGLLAVLLVLLCLLSLCFWCVCCVCYLSLFLTLHGFS